MHVSRIHSREVTGAFGKEVEDTSFEAELEDLHVDIEDTAFYDIDKHINAKFLLALKVSHGISERGIAGIIQKNRTSCRSLDINAELGSITYKCNRLQLQLL